MTRSFFLLCALALTGVPGVARAAEAPASGDSASSVELEQKVRELTKEGIAEGRRGDLEAARTAFTKAWNLEPDTNLAVLLARIEMKLGRFREAAEYWEFYLQNGAPDPATAKAMLAECRAQLGSVRVSGEPGALVYVDGRELGRAPLANDVWLDPGEHTFVARLEGRESPEQSVTLAKGERKALSLVIPPLAQPVATPAPSSTATPVAGREERAGSSGRAVVLVGGSVLTAGALVTGIIHTVKAGNLVDQANELRRAAQLQSDPDSARNNSYCSASQPTPPPQCAELAVKTDEQRTARNVALGSYIAAGVLATGTLVTYLLWPKRSAEAGFEQEFEVAPLAGARGVQLRMKF